jgi:short-subunit dehydrogenase
MKVSGTTVLLTGASSGVGAATARALAGAGARVLVSGRNAARLRAVAEETGGIALEADLAAPGGPAELAATAVRIAAALRPATAGTAPGPPARPAQAVPAPELATGTPAERRRAPESGIDILINNAGIGWAGPLTEMTAAEVAQLVAVNLIAPIELTRLLAPALAAGGGGRVVFISSIAGSTGVTHEAVYAATKAGLAYFAESLRYELAGTGVGVSVVVPGVVDTPFFIRRGKRYSRAIPVPVPAQRVARAVLTAIERGQPVAYVPRWLGFPAWLHGAAPATFRVLAARFG